MTDLPTHITDAELSEYLDGRSDPEPRMRVAVAMARDPTVTAPLNALKANDDEPVEPARSACGAS